MLFGAVLEQAVLDVPGAVGAEIQPTAQDNASASLAPAAIGPGGVTLTVLVDSAAASLAPAILSGKAVDLTANLVNTETDSPSPLVASNISRPTDIGAVLDGTVLDFAIFGGPTNTTAASISPATPSDTASAGVAPAVAAGKVVSPTTQDTASAEVAPIIGVGANVSPATSSDTASAEIAPTVRTSATIAPATPSDTASAAVAPTAVATSAIVNLQVSDVNSDIGSVLDGTVLEFPLFGGPSLQPAFQHTVVSTSGNNAPVIGVGANVSPNPQDTASAAVAPTAVATSAIVAPATPSDATSAAVAPTSVSISVNIRVGTLAVTSDIGSVLDGAVLDFSVFGGVTTTKTVAHVENAATDSLPPTVLAGKNVQPDTQATIAANDNLTAVATSAHVTTTAAVDSVSAAVAPAVLSGKNIIPFPAMDSASAAVTPAVFSGKNVIPFPAMDSASAVVTPEIDTERRRRTMIAIAC